MNKVMIEFFSGQGRMAAAFGSRGYKTLTIDNNKNMKPDLVLDILNFKVGDLPKEYRRPAVLWFGVPCTKFSLAGRKDNFINHVPQSKDASIALALVYRCFEIIKELKPESWFIENPMGYLRTFPFIKKHCRKHVWYCRYWSKADGIKRAKPTDIWTNRGDWISKKCFNLNPNCDHENAPRGCHTGTQGLKNTYERGKYPLLLCEEIADLCENKIRITQKVLK